MDSVEIVFFWLALFCYAAASAGYVYSMTFRNVTVFKPLRAIVMTGLALHTVAVIARYHATGRLPWSGDYENALSGGWIIIAMFSWNILKKHTLQPLGVVILPATLLLMGFGVMRSPSLTPMAATLKTFWLYIHVSFAMVSFGAYTVAMCTSVILLLKSHRGRQDPLPPPNPFLDYLPDQAKLDELVFRYVAFGFVTDAIMIVAGAIWAKDLWGSYWSWDPVETWSLLSWIIYGFALHARLTLQWKMERFARICVFALIAVFITYFGVNFVVDSSIHSFSVR